MTTYINKAAAQGDNFGGITAFGDMANAGSATFVTEGGIFPDSRTVGGYMEFDNSASAGTATLITGGGTFFKAGGGEVAFFFGSPTAANATIINNPGEAERAQGGILEFEYSSTAGHAVITNNGASIDGAFGGTTTFEEPSRADHSTLIANGGSNGGGGGVILFGGGSFGDFARVEVFGNGTLDVENVGGSSGLTIGSLEGDGRVSMGGGPLIVGSNNLSTVFGGMIFDSSFGGGALIKMGRGTLSLITPNTYTGGTIVWEGTLAVRNQHGSPTGTGSVSVKGGNLIGRGIIAGSVVIGTNNGRSSAVLSPGNNPANPQTLTIQSDLTFNMGSTYTCDLNSDSTLADKVVAAGVLIVGDAQISLNDAGSAMLPLGTAFIVLENSSANPISGTFSNLADGSTITVGSNTFQASYEGGDGNDLTLTVE
jgi:autotransporter-associated beta strand protein